MNAEVIAAAEVIPAAEVIAAAEVIPAKAGIQVPTRTLGPGLRRGDF
jgi:hypothetical protein